ncbi:MAG: hypothetical protein ACYCXP_01715 [Leptospirillum sp.]|jgi:hypothetical protein|nr:hypothetical protein [Nitrospiraceae bacterium]
MMIKIRWARRANLPFWGSLPVLVWTSLLLAGATSVSLLVAVISGVTLLAL